MQVLTNFCCSKCKSPIKLDKELLNLKPDAVVELLDSSQSFDHHSHTQQQQQQHQRHGSRHQRSRSSNSPMLSPIPKPTAVTSPQQKLISAKRPSSIASTTNTTAAVSRLTIHSSRPRSIDYSMDPKLFVPVGGDASYIMLPSHPAAHLQKPIGTSSLPSDSHMTNTLKEQQQKSPDDLVDRLRQTAKIFELLSAKSARVDYPVCQDCADGIIATLEMELQRLLNDKHAYEEFLKNEARLNSGEMGVDEEDLKSLQETEQKLMDQLMEVEKQQKQIQKEIQDLEMESERLDRMEQEMWMESGKFEEKMSHLQLENESLNNKYEATSSFLDLCKKTNVYNDTFHIWHNGPFGTINGLRMGRLPDQHVEWSEINAAWGYACLLLSVLAQKIGFEFKHYRLVPDGSFSRVEKVGDDKASYELYGSGELQLSRLFWNRRFDQGMIAFLNCMKQMADFAAANDNTFKLPYIIDKDKIGDVSIKMQFNQDESWTKALKYMLTDLKWLLAFCCKHHQRMTTSPIQSQQ